MATGESVGSIYYDIEIETAKLLTGAKVAETALDGITSTANSTGKALDGLDKESKSAGSSLSKIAGHAKSVDDSMQMLNTNVSAVAMAINQANSSAVASSMTLTQMNVALQALVASTSAVSQSVQATSTATSNAAREFSRAEAIIEGLGNQIAILEEAMENGARGATVLAAQLRAGSAATEEEKKTIGDLAAAFFDLKTASDEAEKSASAVAAGFHRAESAISGLENDVSILSAEMQGGARSAAILAAQLNAGSGATQEQKSKIAELTGTLYDMREAQKSASRTAADAARQLAQEANEATRIASIISDLSNQTKIFSTEQESGARSAAILAAQLRAGDAATQDQKAKIADLVGSLYDMKEAQSAATREAAEASKQLDLESREAERISSVTDSLSQQISILNEQQTNGARSAAILAAQLRLGAKASDEEKQKVGELTGQLFDMQRASAASSGGSKSWKSSMQQAGYQVQDFIVQVQGGQSALVAFSQQGSQLAGAFGPGGAIVGALIALGTVVAGTLISSLNGGKSAMDALKDAAERMNDVISVSTQGIAALSDKYANLARVNATAATLLRNQALIEYNQAISKIPKAIGDAADSVLSFGDKAISALGGGYASVEGFNDRLKSLNITTDDYSSAMKQAYGAGMNFRATADTIGNTVGAVASKLGISEEAAFGLTKQLADLSDNPSPQALQTLALRIGDMISSSKNAKPELVELYNKIVDLSTGASQAAFNFELLKKSTDNLTAGQKSLIQQSERNLALSKLQGAARAKLAAQYAAEDAGFSKDDPHTKRMMDDAAATYANLDSHKKLTAEQKKGESQAERNAKVVEEYSQKAKLAADSTSELSREQAILAAKQKLTNATPQQVAQVERDAAAAWDTANAIKAQAAAQKLLPETRENASYQQDMKDLKTALDGKRITQQQYNQTSEQLEAQHQVNLAKIRAQQTVSPMQEARGQIDPVQQLANQHAQELALIQQFETQKGQLTQRGLELMNAANTQYEQQRIAAQWAIYRNQSLGNEALAASFDALAGNASNALTGVITGSMSAQEAMQSLSSTVLNSLINSFVQMGVEWAKNAIMGAATQQAAIAATTSAQVAGIGVQTAASTTAAAATTAAWTPAAMMSSIASLGGAVAIGVGAMAGILALSGKRKNGGPVSAGSMYQVGEGGKPEIYQASTGKQYMIPGDNGKVISNKDMNGGQVQVNIQFYDQTSGGQHSFQAQASQEGGVVTVEAFLTDVDRNGPMSSAIQGAFGLGRKAQGAY